MKSPHQNSCYAPQSSAYPKINPSTIEEVKRRADIVDVISQHVVLRKAGKELSGLCPFHDEKTHSFSVSPSKQLYYCFGCGATGDAIAFLQQLGNYSFTEVVLDLARRYGVPVSESIPSLSTPLPYPQPKKSKLAVEPTLPEKDYTVSDADVQRSHERLFHPGEVQQLALSWLLGRGYQREMIQHYRLGLESVRAKNSESGSWETYWGIAIFIPVPNRPGRFYQKIRVAPWLGEARPDYLRKWHQTGVPTTVFVTYQPEDVEEGTYFCEGEWDAIALGWAALLAGAKVAIACSTGGCGTLPKPEQMEPLPKPLVIFYDRDQPDQKTGRRAGEYGAKRLAKVLGGDGFVGQVPLPHGCTVNGWDVSDAVAAGYTWSDFEIAAAKAMGECFAIVLYAQKVEYNYGYGSEQRDWNRAWQNWRQHQQAKNSEPDKKPKNPPPDVLGEAIAEEYRDGFAFNNESKCWMRYEADFPGVWSPETEEFMESVVHNLLKAKGIRGFLPNYTANVLRVMRSELLVRQWEEASPKDLLPFENGVLEIATKKLLAHSPGYRFTWSLPRFHDLNATNWDTISDWMYEATGGDAKLQRILLCWLNAVLKGRSDLQRFLHLVGPGGTGKGTALRLCVALIGERNTCSTNLIDWNQNRFEPANAYRKRLLVFFDEDKYSGPLGNFKRLTGGDYLRGEEKGKKAFNFIYDGMTAMASNFPVFAGDSSSGMARRPIVTPFIHAVPKGKVKDLDQLFASELDALTNYVLEIPDQEVTRVLRQLDEESSADITRQTWEYRMRTDSIAAWLNDCVIHESHASEVSGDDKDNLDTLFGNYYQYCSRTNSKPKGSREFSPHLLDLCNNVLGWADVERKRTSNARRVQGLRLRRPGDDDHIPHPIEDLSSQPADSPLSPMLELFLQQQSAKFWLALVREIASGIMSDVSVTSTSDRSETFAHKDSDGYDGSNQVESKLELIDLNQADTTSTSALKQPSRQSPTQINQISTPVASLVSYPSQSSLVNNPSRHAQESLTCHSRVMALILQCQTWVEIVSAVGTDSQKFDQATRTMTSEQRRSLVPILAAHLCQNPADLSQLAWLPEKLRNRALQSLTFTLRRLKNTANLIEIEWENITGCKFISMQPRGTRGEQWVFEAPGGSRFPALDVDLVVAIVASRTAEGIALG